jgi:hypothetical protein
MFEDLFAKQGLSMGRLHGLILLSDSASKPEPSSAAQYSACAPSRHKRRSENYETGGHDKS